MYSDQFKQTKGNFKGEWIGPDECNYDNLEDLYSIGIFGFCGCGRPDESFKYIVQTLEHINLLREKVWEKLMTYSEWEELGKKIFTSDGQEYFTYYVLTKLDLIEHGGSVPGWLTDKGYEILEELKTLCQKK